MKRQGLVDRPVVPWFLAFIGISACIPPPPKPGSCSEDAACGTCRHCVEGACTRSCFDSETCSHDACVRVCHSDADCGKDKTCDTVNDVCIPGAGECASDATCDDGNQCSTDSCWGGACTHDFVSQLDAPCTVLASNDGSCVGSASGTTCLIDAGVACTSDEQCGSGHCVDGVCCDSVCSDLCDSCSSANTGLHDGECGPVTAGSDPHNECPGDVSCDGAGACAYAQAGDACEGDYACASGHCVDGVCCATACTDTCETCNGAAPGTCTSVVSTEDADTCALAVAGGACASPPCACDSSGACKASGAVVCGSGGECASGYCLGGICCSGECSGGCYSCNAADTGAAPGMCAPIREGLDPYDSCPGVAACNGEGACFAKAMGSSCSHDYECVRVAGDVHCVDSVCCNSACDQLCYSCAGQPTTSSSAGFCAPVKNGLDGANECPGATACNGKGACYATAGGGKCIDSFECLSGDCCGSSYCIYGWQAMQSPAVGNLNAVFLNSGTGYAVGDGGVILYYDGSTWTPVQSPTAASLYAASGLIGSTSGAPGVAVGASGTILWHDSAWSVEASGVSVDLHAALRFGPGEAYAAGDSGTILERETSPQAHWVSVASGTTLPLTSMAGDNLGEVYVAGGSSDGTSRMILARSSSTSYQWKPLPTSGFDAGQPVALAVYNSTLYAAAINPSGIYRFGGAGWQKVYDQTFLSFWSPSTSSPCPRLIGVGTANAVAFDGTNWVPYQLPGRWLRGVSGTRDGRIFAVGSGGTIVRY
jgi:hypothetical protein